jgi:flagellar basal body rod protein FlgG
MRAFAPRFSLAGLLLATAGAAGLFGLLTKHMRPKLCQSDSPLDMCVVGDGYLVASDASTGQRHFVVRSAQIGLNINGQFVIDHQGKELLVEPGIVIPVNAATLEVLPDGHVMYRLAGSNINCPAGQLKLAQYTPERLFYQFGDFQTSTPVWEVADPLPKISVPGTNGCGHIRSGLLIRQPSWTEAILPVGRDVFLAACSLVAIQSLRSN